MIFRIIGEVTNHVLRLIDYNASKNVDYYIANSREVAARIKKFYRRDAKVIYPPVDVATALSYFKKQKLVSGLSDRKKKEYFLAGGRLARPKHIDLIVQGCSELGLSLKIFGKSFAGYGKELKHVVLKKNQYLKRLAGRSSEEQNDNNIEFLGEITDEEKWKLMQEAKAFIFASEDEDFGITPVEAMAVGTPVIAYRSGGVKETVIEGKTGVFFDQLTVESLVRALKRFNELNHSIKAEDCRKQAEKFSQERFMSKIKKFISSKYARTS
jgi:glycosyltransferase involved in cell wall biosynthesis